jgi:hypothetical protein
MMLNKAQNSMTRTVLRLKLIVFFLAAFFLNPRSTLAFTSTGGSLPSFADFHRSVQNSEADVVRGVYVPKVLALPVVQQPQDRPYSVSNHDSEVTQFSMASQYGNIGLLAHNNLAGQFFSRLSIGDQVRLIYGDGRVEYFVVTSVLRFQATQPESVSSSFLNLDRTEVLSASEMFSRAYEGERHLVFQTCIEAERNPSWGRLFVIAIPVR